MEARAETSAAASDRSLPFARARPAWLTDAVIIDVAFGIVISIVALALRTYNLSGMPSGLHGDEAATGLDARSILAGNHIWPYTGSALGQPVGPMWWAAAWIRLLGPTVFAVRLPMALLGVGTVLCGFFAMRGLFGRPTAYAGAVLLAGSSWLIFYNRTGFTASAMPFTEMASLLAVVIALKTQKWWWALVAGFVVGAGIYGYFSYPLFALGLAFWVVLYTAIERPRPFLPHVRNVAVMGLMALLVVRPMQPYLTSSQVGYQHDRKLFSLAQTPDYKKATGTGQKVRIYADNARDVADAIMFNGYADSSDGSGSAPALDRLTDVLAVAGLLLSLVLAARKRKAAYLVPWAILPAVAFGPVWSFGGVQRRALGMAPFILMAAAIALGYGWQLVHDAASRWRRPALSASVAMALVLAIYGYINVHKYFSDAGAAPIVSATDGPELTEAALYMKDLPRDTKIYFLSERWSAGYETVKYLMPDRRLGDGSLEDRSLQFGKDRRTSDFANIDRSRASVIMLVGTYIAQAPNVAALYPDAQIIDGPTKMINGRPRQTFVAVNVPAKP